MDITERDNIDADNILLSIILVTYNSTELLLDCVRSIDKLNDIGRKLEIIVVDNSSAEETICIKQKIQNKYPFEIRVYYSGGNKGYGIANNFGAERANGSILCFLNPDTILIEPIFKPACKRFDDIDVRTVGCKLVNESLKFELSFFFVRGYLTPFLTWLVHFLNRMNIKLPNMITSGACMFVRKADFDVVGGFSSSMFLYHEESYLARSFQRHFQRNKFVLNIGSRVIHLEKKSRVSEFLAKEYYKSMAHYYEYFSFNKKMLLMIYWLKQRLRYILRLSSNDVINEEYVLLKDLWSKNKISK